MYIKVYWLFAIVDVFWKWRCFPSVDTVFLLAKKTNKLFTCWLFCGSNWIRTNDPLLVRQML